jgi:hypothetical protein
MARRTIRIGPINDAVIYDDADYPDGIDCEGSIKASSFVGAMSGGSSGPVTVISSLQAGGGGAIGIQYKTRTLTFTSGTLTTLGAESAWVNI